MIIQIICRNPRFLVCCKPPRVLSESPGLPDLLCRQECIPTLYPVHRLDQDTGGAVLLAKDAEACAALQQLFLSGRVVKEYLAVAPTIPDQAAGVFQDLLFHDRKQNKTFVVRKRRKGVREAECAWERISTQDLPETSLSLYRVRLHSGRSHQIRVQFASRGMPLWGDRRYGSAFSGSLGLWSFRMSFPDPWDGQKEATCFSAPPDGMPWYAFKPEIDALLQQFSGSLRL